MAILTRLGMLVALGIAVPLLPPLNRAAQASTSFRTALLIAAAVSLATGAAQVPDYVRMVVERTVLPK